MNRIEGALTFGLFLAVQLSAVFLVRRYWRNPLANFLLRIQGPRGRARFTPITEGDLWLSAAAGATVTALEVALMVALFPLIGSAPGRSSWEYAAFQLVLMTGALAVFSTYMTLKWIYKAVLDDPPAAGKFTITHKGVPIGTTKMEFLETGGLVIWGAFLPSPAFATVAEQLHAVQVKYDHDRIRTPGGLLWDPAMRFTHPEHAKMVEELEIGIVGPEGPMTLPGTLFIQDLTSPGGPDNLVVRIWSPETGQWRDELRRLGALEEKPLEAFGFKLPDERLKLKKGSKS